MKKSYESRVWLLAEIEPAFSLSHEETYYQRRRVTLFKDHLAKMLVRLLNIKFT